MESAPAEVRRPDTLVRALVLRALGGVYLVAFLTAALQGPGLIGARGLLPMQAFLQRVAAQLPPGESAFLALPTVFWIDASDDALRLVAWLGVALSALVLAGVGNAVVQLVLWALYLSIVKVGQTFWSFGWESLLLEAGFLSIFLVGVRQLASGSPRAPDPTIPLLLLRWLTFRLMLGAGLIKLRGDACWWDLSCLFHHFETQPNPNPLSAWLHHAPRPLLQAGVLANHVVELVAPWFVFGPKRLRRSAGALLVGFQLALLASGNLAFVNWLTLAISLSVLDDDALLALVPRALRPALQARRAWEPPPPTTARLHRAVVLGLALLVAVLSVQPVRNLLSSEQVMNRPFDRLHLVNTYGMFGSVGRERREVVLEGTDAETPESAATWRAYELPCKPGDPLRLPCWVSPYHLRLDWQLWFVPLVGLERQVWIFSLLHRLLQAEPAVLALVAHDPFDGAPPRWVRVSLYEYRLAPPWQEGPVWERRPLGTLVRPISRDDPELQQLLVDYELPR